MKTNKTKLLTSLLEDAKSMAYRDGNLDKVKKRGEMIVPKIFGSGSVYLDKIMKIRYSPTITFSGIDNSVYHGSFEAGKSQLINLINVMLEDLSLAEVFETIDSNTTNNNSKSEKIFIVHGHNEEMKQSSARFLEKLDLRPIILHEQPNKGKTIIEKFTDFSDVSFALILLSGDDAAFGKNETSKKAKLRARQNVILELGYFLGKIGRENVVVLHEILDNFEIPSDYQGVIYIPYDNAGNWRLSVAKELRAVGFEIDGNKLLE